MPRFASLRTHLQVCRTVLTLVLTSMVSDYAQRSLGLSTGSMASTQEARLLCVASACLSHKWACYCRKLHHHDRPTRFLLYRSRFEHPCAFFWHVVNGRLPFTDGGARREHWLVPEESSSTLAEVRADRDADFSVQDSLSRLPMIELDKRRIPFKDPRNPFSNSTIQGSRYATTPLSPAGLAERRIGRAQATTASTNMSSIPS